MTPLAEKAGEVAAQNEKMLTVLDQMLKQQERMADGLKELTQVMGGASLGKGGAVAAASAKHPPPPPVPLVPLSGNVGQSPPPTVSSVATGSGVPQVPGTGTLMTPINAQSQGQQKSLPLLVSFSHFLPPLPETYRGIGPGNEPGPVVGAPPMDGNRVEAFCITTGQLRPIDPKGWELAMTKNVALDSNTGLFHRYMTSG